MPSGLAHSNLESLHVAVACSNLQRKHEVPTVVSAVLSSTESRSELDRMNLPPKRLLLHRKSSLDQLRSAFEDAEPFLFDFMTEELETLSWSPLKIGQAYLKVIDSLMGRNQLLRFIASIRTITLRTGIVTPGFGYRILPKEIHEEMKKRCDAIVSLEDKANDPLLKTAQNLATMRYEELRNSSSDYVLTKIRKHPNSYSQILRVGYPSPNPDEFDSYFVGLPTLTTRHSNGDLFYSELRAGAQLDFAPTSKFCCGNMEGGESVPCVAKSAEKPFGSPLSKHSREERCDLCRIGNEFVDCLTRRPSCDGLRVVCGNEEFAAQICINKFGLYVTRFRNALKIGTAFLPNLLGRLLYQGANSAVVLYPILGIENAWLQEGQLQAFLSSQLDVLRGFGIQRIQRHSPGVTEKLEDFCLTWNRDDTAMLDSIVSFIVSSNHSRAFARVEVKPIFLLWNYLKPSDFLLEKALHRGVSEPLPWRFVKGRMSGYRGSFLFFDGGTVIDSRHLRGVVVEAPH